MSDKKNEIKERDKDLNKGNIKDGDSENDNDNDNDNDKSVNNISTCTIEDKKMMDKDRIIHIIINFIIYFIVILVKDDASALLILLRVLPALLAINSFIYGFKAKGCDSVYSFTSALAFVPFVFIFLGETGWTYLLIYVSLIMLSNVSGSFISGLFKKEDDPIGCNCKGIF